MKSKPYRLMILDRFTVSGFLVSNRGKPTVRLALRTQALGVSASKTFDPQSSRHLYTYLR